MTALNIETEEDFRRFCLSLADLLAQGRRIFSTGKMCCGCAFWHPGKAEGGLCFRYTAIQRKSFAEFCGEHLPVPDYSAELAREAAEAASGPAGEPS